MSDVRMDKWLWAARFFKTRALAAKACDMGRVHAGEIAAKPARDVRVGDRLTVRNEAGEFVIDVLALSSVRGPAATAAAGAAGAAGVGVPDGMKVGLVVRYWRRLARSLSEILSLLKAGIALRPVRTSWVIWSLSIFLPTPARVGNTGG